MTRPGRTQRPNQNAIQEKKHVDISKSFAPLVGRHMHTLVLGTMPGQKSLQRRQYYAHPRNALWPILCAMVTGDKPDYSIHQTMTYDERCSLITDQGIALWDVLASCERPGSLDGSILRTTEIPNNIVGLIEEHPELRTVACNGRTAEALFKRHIPGKPGSPASRTVSLPSTSPAMASLTLEEKYQRWADALSL